MERKNTYVLCFHTKGNICYTYIEGDTIDEAWKTACNRYGEENLEFMS